MKINRRDFLKVSFVAGSGLVMAIYLDACDDAPTPESTPNASATATRLVPTPTHIATSTPAPEAYLTPNVFVTISTTGIVTITVHRSEMGQGVRTALPMIVADELGADWSMVRVEQAPGDDKYGDQSTGGSRSVTTCYTSLRVAGAIARQLLVNAACQNWNLDAKDCYTENSLVIHRPTGKQQPFGDLIELAATLPVPKSTEVKLKDQADFRIIGTNKGRLDNAAILTGRAVFGMDVKLPGMLYAVVARSPVFNGTVVSYDDSATRKVAGVREVVPIDNGIAVVAEGSWQALQGRSLLQVEWHPTGNASLYSADIEQSLLEKVTPSSEPAGELVRYYTFSYFAHATMEPMNCTVDVRGDTCEAWVPTQSPQAAIANLSSILGLKTKITVHVPLIGCGFGRRIERGPDGFPISGDYVREAAQISRAVGAPIHLMWTRRDDFDHDLYHPLSVTRVHARLDYVKSLRMNRIEATGLIPTGYWRSVTNPPEAFARESFLDEYALEKGVDPVVLRRDFLDARAQAVVEKAAEMADWGSPLPVGAARGIAHFATWGTTNVAQVAEVVADGSGIRVPRVFCAVDCGVAINPDMIVAQMESGIVFSLTAALKEAMLIENGIAMKTSFIDYPILRFDEMPQVEVTVIQSKEPPTGIGEMSNPVTAPAVANAIYALTGQRLRKMPLKLKA